MMIDLKQAIACIESAVENPVQTWCDYLPTQFPVIVYTDDVFASIHHPNPPDVRPDNLMAATAVEINGALTATIPLAMCPDAQALIPLVYHECFHVYQAGRFKFEGKTNFFEVLAYYPELNPMYRALCAAECEVLNDPDWSSAKKLACLAKLADRRHQILAQRPGLRSFEHDLERNEGTASYVEQKARAEIFDIRPQSFAERFSYSRQYIIGAALGWLLDDVDADGRWQKMVESGDSLSACAAELSKDERVNLDEFGLAQKAEAQQEIVDGIVQRADSQVEVLFAAGAMTIKLPNQKNVARSFNPSTIVSFGDGRLIHPNGVSLYLPNGKIEIKDGMVLENYVDSSLTFAVGRYDYAGQNLVADTERVNMQLADARQQSGRVFEVSW